MNLSFKFPSVYRQFQGDQAELNVRLGLCILFYLRLYVCMHILPCLFICTGYGVYIWYAHSFSQNLSEDIKIDRPVTFTLSIQLTVPIPHPGAQYFTNTLLFITAVSQEWEHNNLSGLEIKLSMGTEYQKDTSVKKKYMYKYSDKCFIILFISINTCLILHILILFTWNTKNLTLPFFGCLLVKALKVNGSLLYDSLHFTLFTPTIRAVSVVVM